jgi:hypothetical protein
MRNHAALLSLAIGAAVVSSACKRATLGGDVDAGGGGGIGIGIGRDAGSIGDLSISDDGIAIDAPPIDTGLWMNPGNLAFCPQSLPLQDCPAAPPAAGGACLTPGARCDYGDNLNVACRASWGCGADRTWQLLGAGCTATGLTACPVQVATGQACDIDAACSYPDGKFCACSSASGQWTCWTSPITDCPNQLPLYGAPCGPSWMFCRYGGCFDYGAACCGGHWIPDRFACSGGP